MTERILDLVESYNQRFIPREDQMTYIVDGIHKEDFNLWYITLKGSRGTIAHFCERPIPMFEFVYDGLVYELPSLEEAIDLYRELADLKGLE